MALNGPILLITDLSARCDRAMDRAIALAKDNGVSLVVLHVMDAPWLTRLAKPDWQRQQQDHMEQAQVRLQHDLAGQAVNVELQIEKGNPVEVIEQVATAKQCSLIVSGTARDETLGRVVLGNTVARLARRVNIPLLIVRHRPHVPYTDVMVATDFSKGSSQALTTAKQLFGDASITLYHAFNELAGIYELDQPTVDEQIKTLEQQAQHFVQTTLDAQPADLSVVIEHGLVTETLPARVAAQSVKVVALGTHGATGIVRMTMGSVAETLLEKLDCDVLIVPQAAA
jgi:nucleotide-binding universal stress UspA family protein